MWWQDKVRYGGCVVCGKGRPCVHRFSMVNPRTGLGYDDVFINPKTGNLNHPWSSGGKWVLVCFECERVTECLLFHRP